MKALLKKRILPIIIILIFSVSASFGQMTSYNFTVENDGVDVTVGSTNQLILKVEIIVGTTSITLNKLTVKDDDATADYKNMKMWYTTTNSFAMTSQYGGTMASVAVSNNPNDFILDKVLATGSHYFWVTVDVDAAAPTGDIINCRIARYKIDGSASNFSSPPEANREIVAASGSNMAFQSINVTQASTADVVVGTTDNKVLKIEIVTTGANNPLEVDKIRMSLTGSTSLLDIDAAKVYYTGTTNTFSTGNLFGTMVAPTLITDVKNVIGSQFLSEGSNYFWVSIDVASGATNGDFIDARIRKVFVDGTDVLNAVEQDPAGHRKIVTNLAQPDTPCNAWEITVGCSGKKLVMNNTGLSDSGIPTPSCGSYSGGDVWSKLEVPTSGSVQIETYPLGLTDVAMAVYKSSSNCNGTLTELACNDNSGFGNMSKVEINGLTSGEILYVRVWDNNNNETGTFEIDAVDVDRNYCVTGSSVDLGYGCAQLTDAVNGQNGSVWDANDKLNFTNDWSYDFKVNLGTKDTDGADGICFVIQNDPNALSTVSGGDGVQIGAGDISNSLIVEIDTYLNDEDRNNGIAGVVCSGGSDPDHLDIWLNGDIEPSGGGCSDGVPSGTRYIPNAVALTNGGLDYNIENGLDHTFRISFISATGLFTAEVLDDAGTTSYGSVSYTISDVMSLFHTNCPYFGLVASTGGMNNAQSACLAEEFESPLPVSLLNFNAECTNGNVLLKWSTASEINNDYFVVEKSKNAKDFVEIAKIDGSGNTNQQKKYSYLDEDYNSQKTYYRLKQVNYDGSIEYHKIIVSDCVNNNINTDYIFKIYPNPFREILSIQSYEHYNETFTLEIKDYLGRTLIKKKVQKISTKYDLDLGQLNKGMYFLSIYNYKNKQVLLKKIVKN